MATGTVKFFNGEKGFGFITPSGGGSDIFVHISALQASGLETLRDGQKVSFDTEPDMRGKGPKAINIRLDEA
jgi:CspA family cold shock protein